MNTSVKDACHLAFGLAVLAITGFTQSGVLLTFIMMSLYAALLSQAWNILGGYGGQLSFGHALFRRGRLCPGAGPAVAGLESLAYLALCDRAGHGGGLAVGGLTFRYGLRGSCAGHAGLRRGAAHRGDQRVIHRRRRRPDAAAARRAANMQFPSRHGYIYLILASCCWRWPSRPGCAARASAPICRPCATTRTRRAPSASIRCA